MALWLAPGMGSESGQTTAEGLARASVALWA